MSTVLFAPEEYLVFHFTLASPEGGIPTQKTESCGIFRSVEEAFSVARMRALKMMIAKTDPVQGDPSQRWAVIATEFGYDVKCEYLVVSRFWVHAKPVLA